MLHPGAVEKNVKIPLPRAWIFAPARESKKKRFFLHLQPVTQLAMRN
jgi:hypothetical protein